MFQSTDDVGGLAENWGKANMHFLKVRGFSPPCPRLPRPMCSYNLPHVTNEIS